MIKYPYVKVRFASLTVHLATPDVGSFPGLSWNLLQKERRRKAKLVTQESFLQLLFQCLLCSLEANSFEDTGSSFKCTTFHVTGYSLVWQWTNLSLMYNVTLSFVGAMQQPKLVTCLRGSDLSLTFNKIVVEQFKHFSVTSVWIQLRNI